MVSSPNKLIIPVLTFFFFLLECIDVLLILDTIDILGSVYSNFFANQIISQVCRRFSRILYIILFEFELIKKHKRLILSEIMKSRRIRTKKIQCLTHNNN